MVVAHPSLLFTLYTTSWCGDCVRTKAWLDQHGYQAGIDYVEIDIEDNPQAAQTVETINDGRRSVPTLVFADHTTLTEPSNLELKTKLDMFKT